MGATILAAAGGAVAALLVVAFVALLRRRNRTRADLEAMLDAALRESDDLRARLEALTEQLPASARPVPAEAATYLITDAGRAGELDVPRENPITVPDRLVLSATVGKPLVRIAAFGHGVRRALSPENRNRIRFEMRKQVRSSRKRRRRAVRDHVREVRADERARETLA